MELEQHELNYIFLFAKIVSGNRNQLVIQKKRKLWVKTLVQQIVIIKKAKT